MKNLLNKLVFPALLIVILLFSGRFFFNDKLFDTHDLEYHAARTANYYLALKQGQFPPRWSPNLNYSFGLPTFIFAYPLPYIVATAFFVLVGNIQLAINLSLLLFWLLGGLAMFYYARLRTRNSLLSLLVSMSYFTAPYTLLNFFERGAFGETSFFATLPLVLIIIHLQNKITSPLFVLGSYFVGVVFLLSHPQSLVVTIPILVAWMAIAYKQSFLQKFWQKKILLLAAIIFSVQFFWTPLIFEAKQTSILQAVSLSKLLHSFPVFFRLFWPTLPATQVAGSQMLVTDFSTTIGVASLVIVLGGVFVVVRKRAKRGQVFWLLTFLLTIFFMHPMSSFIWSHIGPLKVMQFPWRLLAIATLASSMLLIEFQSLLAKHRPMQTILFILIFLVALANLTVWGKPSGFISRSNYDWFEYFGTASSFGEFIPREFNHEKNLKLTDKVSFDPSGKVAINFWNGSRMRYEVSLAKQTRVLQKTAYFPGWKVFVDKKTIVIDHNLPQYPGRITFLLPAGQHSVETIFTNQTPIRQLADVISLLGFALMIFLLKPVALLAKLRDNLRHHQNT